MTNIQTLTANTQSNQLRIGIVQARFNGDICHDMLQTCIAELLECGVQAEDILPVTVPGALEIPSVLQQMAQSGQFDALIAIGAVIRGETYHFEIVSNESCAGVTRVSLDYNIPIANAILTTETEQQAFSRAKIKAKEAAQVALEMANLQHQLALLEQDETSESED